MSKRHDIFIASEADRINNNNNSSLPRIIRSAHIHIITGSGVIYYIMYRRVKKTPPQRAVSKIYSHHSSLPVFYTSSRAALFRLMISAAALTNGVRRAKCTQQRRILHPGKGHKKLSSIVDGSRERKKKGKHAPPTRERREFCVCVRGVACLDAISFGMWSVFSDSQGWVRA